MHWALVLQGTQEERVLNDRRGPPPDLLPKLPGADTPLPPLVAAEEAGTRSGLRMEMAGVYEHWHHKHADASESARWI